MNTSFVSFLALLLISAAAAQNTCTGSATYSVRFNYRWTQARFPNRPSNAHFSPLVAFSHINRFSAFSRYGYATEGVKNVAETGSTVNIRRELTAAKDTSQVLDFSVDGRIPDGDASASVQVKVDCNNRYISAITMIAPSPDWFLAVFRESVVKNGKFVRRVAGPLRAYDAGTDSGEAFRAPDQVSSPQENIAPLDGPSFNGRVVGRFIIRRMGMN